MPANSGTTKPEPIFLLTDSATWNLGAGGGGSPYNKYTIYHIRAVGSACICAEVGIARAVCCGEAGGPSHDFVLVQK